MDANKLIALIVISAVAIFMTWTIFVPKPGKYDDVWPPLDMSATSTYSEPVSP